MHLVKDWIGKKDLVKDTSDALAKESLQTTFIHLAGDSRQQQTDPNGARSGAEFLIHW